MLYLMRSAGMLAALARSTARRRRGLVPRSPPPARAATVISRMMRVHTLPRFRPDDPCGAEYWPIYCVLTREILKKFVTLSVELYFLRKTHTYEHFNPPAARKFSSHQPSTGAAQAHANAQERVQHQ